MQPKLYLILSCIVCLFQTARGQDSIDNIDRIFKFPSSFLSKVNSKTARLEALLTKQTERYLHELAKKEARIKNKLFKIDSVAAKNCFALDPAQSYEALIQKAKTTSDKSNSTFSGSYMPYVDSLKSCLIFLENNPQLLNNSKITSADVQKSIGQLQQLEGKMRQADGIRQFVRQRKQTIKNYLAQQTQLPGSITNSFNEYSKQAYYYSEQLNEYKEVLNDPDKMLKTALALLNKVPAFTSFMKQHSMLAALFNFPGTGGNIDPMQAVTGLQTRSQVTQNLQTQMGATGPNINGIIQQNVQSAQGQISLLKEKLNSLGGSGGGDLDLPDFKPNKQKIKSFLQRLEYGTNIQSAQSTYFFPTTTDLGLSVGYKLNDKSIIGIGVSYKIGWGKDFRHIKITQQGLGLRSFLDIKLKGSFYASGGFEYNYQQPFKGLIPSVNGEKQGEPSSWQKSGLIGLTKVISLKSKILKKSKLQFLWDFLSYYQKPQMQAFKFRIGYNF